jgi:dTDP-4-amino-4,6-dideoxygalactose transaminase
VQHRQVAEEVSAGWREVIANGEFILGDVVRSFEREYAEFSSIGHCVSVANGTDALELALRAIGIGPGDEVILPVNTFVASAFAVVRAGAVPVFVDVSGDDYLIDTEQVSAKLSSRTKAVMPVHLYGQMAPVERLHALLEPLGIPMVEDAAQAHGATRHGLAPGGFSAAVGTSFYPGKNLGAYGDAGAVLTRSDVTARSIRSLRNYGSEEKYLHPEIGFNSRTDPLQAVVLRAKLKRLTAWNKQRRSAADRYNQMFEKAEDIRTPATLAGNEHVWHLYVVRVARRTAVLERLAAAGITAGVHYPLPLHLQGAMQKYGYRSGEFPVSESAATEILSLPMYPGITIDQQELVAAELMMAVSS